MSMNPIRRELVLKAIRIGCDTQRRLTDAAPRHTSVITSKMHVTARASNPLFCAILRRFTLAHPYSAPVYTPFARLRFLRLPAHLKAAAQVTPPTHAPADAKCARFAFKKVLQTHIAVRYSN